MLAAIDGAQRQILFETYIWKGDEIGEQFKAALAAAADRGVEVYCIYDGFANLVVSPRFKRFPPTMKVLRYPSTPPAGGSSTCAATAATTARSWSSTTRSASSAATTSARRTPPSGATPTCGSPGPGVWDLKRAFADFWNLNRRRRIGTSASGRCCSRPRRPGSRGSGSTATCRGCGCSRSGRCTSRRSTGPRSNVWMTHAYFLPDQDFVDAMKAAAQRGVDVRLLLPLKSNHIVADWISRGYFSQLLDAGVRIFRFQDAMVHAKTSTIDGTWSTVGTANIDRLSLQGNYEINVEVIDPDFAADDGGDLRRPTSPTASSSPPASGRPATCTASSPR